MSSTTEDTNASNSLHKKVTDWLGKEGYPLEFTTAHEFRSRGFSVHQGVHYTDPRKDVPREIDVVAERTTSTPSYWLRVSNVVECKMSPDKPWVVFTSNDGQITPQACLSQTIGSSLGHAALWWLAEEEDLHSLQAFSTPERPGFGAVQALKQHNRDSDPVFAALQAVVTATNATAAEYDRINSRKIEMPRFGVILLPIIVLEGHLFEAFLDEKSGQLLVEPSSHIRLHWRGAQDWDLHATVDVVTRSHLSNFVKQRAEEMPVIFKHLNKACENIQECFRDGNIDRLRSSAKAAGKSYYPPLLRALEMKNRLPIEP